MSNIYGDVFVFVEQVNGDLQPISLELIAAGKTLAQKLDTRCCVMLLGKEVRHLVGLITAHGADVVIIAEHPELKKYRTLPYRRVVADILRNHHAEIALFGATTVGRDLAPRVAAALETGLTADTTQLDVGDFQYKSRRQPEKTGHWDKVLLAIRPSFGESLLATIVGPWNLPQMATVRRGIVDARSYDSSRRADLVIWKVDLVENDFRLVVEETVMTGKKKTDLSIAKIIVAGGFGVGSEKGFELIEAFADHLGAEVGASRRVVDAGWVAHERQIGQTGQTVKPDFYIACGISGAIQHRVGMGRSDTIIAINTDVTAPIFTFAHYGIVGDLFDVIPALMELIPPGREVERPLEEKLAGRLSGALAPANK